MKKLYDKNQLTFALVWIAIYVVLSSVADSVSDTIGIEKIITAPLLIVLSLFLSFWLERQKLNKIYGITTFSGNKKAYLYFVPLILLMSVNLWNGVQLNMSIADTLLYIVSMLCVGFLEELIFRGFLFQAILKDGIKKAFIISSLTFGFGHIVNLLNGAELLPTLLQIVYAVAIGFLFTVLYYKGGSLLPCIITHSVFNALSAFAVEPNGMQRIITCLIVCAIAVVYSLWILYMKEKES